MSKSNKKAINIEFNGKIIASKPLLMNDNLVSIREKIAKKVNAPYLFVDKNEKTIVKEDEENFKLEDITTDKLIKLKSIESNINIFLNDNNICTIEYPKDKNLGEIREIINQSTEENFIFLDLNDNSIDIEDETDYNAEDILRDTLIKISSKSTNINLDSTSNSSKSDNENIKNTKANKNKPDLSKYDVIEKRDNITFYKYSKVERQSNHELVFLYHFDNFDVEDYSNAFVVLFCGKTGDGKTTAINAFFNIVKGVKLEDDYRFILIEEPEKEKKQAESQTDGVHIYYLKDYKKRPVIIIDSQGYGDTRGKTYDEMVDNSFRYVFSHIIDHINTVCFIVKSNTNRLDILTKYIFSSVTSLFSEDITENFIILATFANKDTIKNGPDFISSIQTDADFLKINERMNQKWWYSFDSKCILDNENDKLTKYSFSNANDLYDKNVTLLKPKSIAKSSEVLNTRNELRIEVNNLNNQFQNLIIEQENLERNEKAIDEVSAKIQGMEIDIAKLESRMDQKNKKELENELRKLNEELNERLYNLNNQTETKLVKTLVRDNNHLYTTCHTCKRNCHDPCDCFFQILGRCTVFTFWKKRCEKCGCNKDSHVQDYYYFTTENVIINRNTDAEQRKERENYERKKQEYLEEMNKNYNEKNSIEKQKNELNFNKNILIEKKKSNIKDKFEIENKIRNINTDILIIIMKLQSISEKINDIAMNNHHLKTEEEYLDDLMDKMDKMNLKEEEKREKIKKIKQNNITFQKAIQLDRKELTKLSDEELSEKLKILLPSNQKII